MHFRLQWALLHICIVMGSEEGGGSYGDPLPETPDAPPPPVPPPLAPWPPGVICENSCNTGTPEICDDFSEFETAACKTGTDCSDCGARSLCQNCPETCRQRGFRLGRNSYCWDHEFHGEACSPNCNNWECGYPSCSTDQKVTKCVADQGGSLKASLVSVPANYTSANVVTGSIAVGAKAQLEMLLKLDQITINFDSNINSMRARIEFAVHLKWRDSRLRTMPCKDLLEDMFKTTTATTDAERLKIDPYKSVMWWPQLLVQGDSVEFHKKSTVKLVTSTVKTYPDTATNWTESVLPFDGAPICRDCIAQNLTMTHEYALPLWEYSAFPFDKHNITVLLGVPNSHIFNCRQLLGSSADRSKLLPTTGEWEFVEGEAVVTEHPVVQGVPDLSQCQLRMTVKRNSIVFLIKQVVTSVMIVYAGLCAPFLDATDHTGDRVALILVSALIVVVSFQADFGLGKISYLIWFDYFNLTQMGVLALALIETLIEHRSVVGQWPENKRVAINKVGTYFLLLGAYPLALAAVFIYGAGYTMMALLVFGVGLVVLILLCILAYRHYVTRANSRQKKLIRRLQKTPLESPEFRPLLKELFHRYDAEGNNLLSEDTVRRFMRQIFRSISAADYAFIMTSATRNSTAEVSYEMLLDAIELWHERNGGTMSSRAAEEEYLNSQKWNKAGSKLRLAMLIRKEPKVNPVLVASRQRVAQSSPTPEPMEDDIER